MTTTATLDLDTATLSGVATRTGGSDNVDALTDDLDTSYITMGLAGRITADFSAASPPSPPDDDRILVAKVTVRVGPDSSKPSITKVTIQDLNGKSALSFFVGGADPIGDYDVQWPYQLATVSGLTGIFELGDGAATPPPADGIRVLVEQVGGTGYGSRVYELAAEVQYQSRSTVTLDSPSGTYAGLAINIAATATDPDDAYASEQHDYEYAYELQSVVDAVTGTPENYPWESEATYYSSVGAFTLPAADDYYIAVRARKPWALPVGGEWWSLWDVAALTASPTSVTAPSITTALASDAAGGHATIDLVPPDGVNLLPDYGSNAGDTSSGSPRLYATPFWQLYSGAGFEVYENDDSYAAVSNYSIITLHIQTGGPTDGVVRCRPIPIGPSEDVAARLSLHTDTSRTVNLRIIALDSDQADLSTVDSDTGTQTFGDGWVEYTAAGTTPANTAYVVLEWEVEGMTGNEFAGMDNAQLVRGSQVAWAAGAYKWSYEIQRSYDGTTWEDLTITNADPAPLGIELAAADGTFEQGQAAIRYRARLLVTASDGTQAVSSYATASPNLDTSGQEPWFLRDVADPATYGTQLEVEAPHDVGRERLQGIFRDMDGNTIVVDQAVYGWDGTLIVQWPTTTEREALQALTGLGRTLYLSSPDGRYWYIRVAGRETDSMIRMVDDRRILTIPYVEVAAP